MVRKEQMNFVPKKKGEKKRKKEKEFDCNMARNCHILSISPDDIPSNSINFHRGSMFRTNEASNNCI